MKEQNVDEKTTNEPINEIKFAEGSVPVAVAARVFGKEAHWIRAGIIVGWLPIGTATRNGPNFRNMQICGLKSIKKQQTEQLMN